MKSQPLADSAVFESDIAGYLHELKQDGVVSRSHNTLHDLQSRWGSINVANELARVNYGDGRSVYCGNWADETQPPHAHRIYDIKTGQCIGTLQAVDEEAVQSAPGIQNWSRK